MKTHLLILNILAFQSTWPFVDSSLCIELSSDTFDTIVDGSTNVLVLFSGADCAHCKAIETDLEELAWVVKPEHDLALAMVDGDSEPALLERFDITGFPTFKWFQKGSVEASQFYFVHFGGQRMGDTLVKLIAHESRLPHLKPSPASSSSGERGDGEGVTDGLVMPRESDHWKKLTLDAFRSLLEDTPQPPESSGPLLVFITTPWNDRDDVKIALRKVGDALHSVGTSPSLAMRTMSMTTGRDRDFLAGLGLKAFPALVVFGEQSGTEATEGRPLLGSLTGVPSLVDPETALTFATKHLTSLPSWPTDHDKQVVLPQRRTKSVDEFRAFATRTKDDEAMQQTHTKRGGGGEELPLGRGGDEL